MKKLVEHESESSLSQKILFILNFIKKRSLLILLSQGQQFFEPFQWYLFIAKSSIKQVAGSNKKELNQRFNILPLS